MNMRDPLGLDGVVIVDDQSPREGPMYGGDVTFFPDETPRPPITVPGSRWPDIDSDNPGTSAGSWPAYYGEKAHHGIKDKRGRHGIVLNNNQDVDALGKNPNNYYKNTSVGIHIHCGYRSERGSAGCVTIDPNYCNRLFGRFVEHEELRVIILKTPPPTLPIPRESPFPYDPYEPLYDDPTKIPN